MKLNIGCGIDVRIGWVNLDAVNLPGVDVVHDLDTIPWPFDSCCFEEVDAFDVFEHVSDPLGFVAELHRVLAPGGMALIHTTHWRSPNAWTDPTHRRTATERTFDYWIPGTELHRRYGVAYTRGCHFQKIDVRMDGTELAFTLRKVA
ncbi:MAG: class I SAM-dependent methyltransferase [Sciscionella sp.]